VKKEKKRKEKTRSHKRKKATGFNITSISSQAQGTAERIMERSWGLWREKSEGDRFQNSHVPSPLSCPPLHIRGEKLEDRSNTSDPPKLNPSI